MTAITDIGFVRMRISKVVALTDGDRVCEFVVRIRMGRYRWRHIW